MKKKTTRATVTKKPVSPLETYRGIGVPGVGHGRRANVRAIRRLRGG